jgi:hypothetical protein
MAIFFIREPRIHAKCGSLPRIHSVGDRLGLS